ncbi:hypothetical protein E2C01_076014 [Portunus trituberculatus]|uniref:Uncharacterized protein n=1 Tax=Portunus trituberculatus TaxID=210409 RepID=A0A5B7IAA1_PORTR|nr:hypothetical protein [Portunus trituberculatus]
MLIVALCQLALRSPCTPSSLLAGAPLPRRPTTHSRTPPPSFTFSLPHLLLTFSFLGPVP